jgi:phosphoglycolate phosphatase-like HAD superfamily hydrolase
LSRRLIIFDVEGTLIDCVPPTLACWRDAFAAHGFSVSLEALHEHSGRDPNDMIRLLLPRAAAERFSKTLQDAQGRCYRDRFLAKVKPFPRVLELFHAIKRGGALTALATTCSAKELAHYVNTAGIADCVDYVACGDDVSRKKPHPDLIRLVLSRSAVAAADAVMVGDTPYDAAAAGAAGVAAIGLLSGGFTEERLLSAGCCAVYRDVGVLEDSVVNSSVDSICGSAP